MALYEGIYIPLGNQNEGVEASGTWTYIVPDTSYFVAEILIGDTVVWSAINSLPEEDVRIDVAGIFGTQRLRFRIRYVEP